MSEELQIAFVGLAGTILGALIVLLTSIGAGLATIVRDANERIRTSRKVHEKYSDPLAASASALMWRLQELVKEGGRDYYLQSGSTRTSFEMYKATSTLYRLAVSLAWIRGLRREIFFLRADKRRLRKNQIALETAINQLVDALADGDHMETQRVIATAAYLRIDIPDDQLEQLGATVDFELDRFVHARGKLRIRDLNEREQREAVRLTVSRIGGKDAVAQLDDELRDLRKVIDAREAWIYRDWQAAIGDLLLSEASTGPRTYDVIGYREFEHICENGSEEQKKWLRRLNTLLDNLDMSTPPDQDARVDVLKAAYRACGAIIIAISELQNERSPIDDRALEAAKAAAAS